MSNILIKYFSRSFLYALSIFLSCSITVTVCMAMTRLIKVWSRGIVKKNAFRKSRLGLCQFLPSDWMIKKQRNISMRANVIKKKDIWPWLRVMLGTLYQIHREKAGIFSVFNWPTGVTLLSYLFDCHSKVSLQGDPYWSMICGKIRRSRLSKRIFLFWW